MSCAEFCTCNDHDCCNHPKKQNNECTPCIEKNLKNYEIPTCFFDKIGEESRVNSEWSFFKFAEKVISSSNHQ